MKNIPFNFAQEQGVFFDTLDNKLVLCHRPDVELATLQEVRRWNSEEFHLQQLKPSEFSEGIQRIYADRDDVLDGMPDVEEMGLGDVAAAMEKPEDLLKNEDDAPIIKMLNAIFLEAIRKKASDIHLEPHEDQLHIRFRIDGTLTTVLTPSPQLTPLLVSRVKVLARLDIAEKRVPQDGRISLLLGGRAVDLRVSTLPSSFGERVVLRILDKGMERPSLSKLGMSEEMQRQFRMMVNRPHGIVLVTGPTGSGKSTTLYAALAEIDYKQRNVMTIEDPIEYNIEGISQTQVNTKANMTFAKGLRAILRQDPDVVLIGEIRDKETADIAVQASLTGHLVLSTLHTNTATGAVTRLGDMDVEPFLLTATLQGVLAQRLVRRLCPYCREQYQVDVEELKHWGLEDQFGPEPIAYRAKGCEQCSNIGYIGRFGLYDLVIMDDPLRQMIHEGASELKMETHVRKTQPSLRESGIARVRAGDTTLEEVLAVTLD